MKSSGYGNDSGDRRVSSQRKTAVWGIIWFSGIIVLALTDQYTKYLAQYYLKGQPSVPLIRGVLELSYLENRGMAFGMLKGGRILFLALCVVFLVALFYAFIRIPKEKKYLPLIVIGAVLGGGAAGNFIDRLIRGYVVDFIYISLINFPVFNLADIYVVCGGAALVFALIFVYKEGVSI